MERKDEFIELVQWQLCGGDLTSDLMDRYHTDIIAPIIGDVMDAFLRNAYRQSSAAKGYKDYAMLDPFLKRFLDVEVKCDETTGEMYSILPVRVIDLMDNDGIHTICDMKNQSVRYVPIPSGADQFYSDTHDGPTAFNYYKQEGIKIYYKFRIHDKDKVFMRLVPNFDELEDDDIIGSAEIISRNGVVGVVDEVRRRMLSMPPTKQTEDNTTKQV